ncbi:hypothetical protein LTR27_012503 [Elasticomyces elasticus]|nr:hypothetical protein LTR27_012503 [Elasticomyces elasticus]
MAVSEKTSIDQKRAESEDYVEYAERKGSTTVTEVDDLSAIEATAASKAAWLISITISLGGFLFGYDTGYISSVLVTIGTSLGHKLSTSEQELVTSLTSGGALLGAVFAGLIADRFGRKWPIWCACAVFIIGTVLQTAAYSVVQFAVGRLVVGLGVGSAAMICPLYIGEIAPAKYRGRMISFNNMSVTLGQLVASAIGAGLATVKGEGWRGTVGIGSFPAIGLAIMLLICPESPRQLVAHGRLELADAVLLKIYQTSTREQRQAKIRSIEMSIQEATSSLVQESLWVSFKRIFTTASTARAVAVACITMAISQLGGFNTLMYYSSTLFAIVGFSNATAVGITVSATNFFHYIPIDLATLTVESDNVGWPGVLVLVTIIIYVGFYSTGVATIAWIGTELIPLEVRALGTMLNTVTCWSTNIIIASTFLSMMKGITPSGAFGFYCGICFVGWLFVVFCYPDVKGMPLETIREVFNHGFGLRYSKQWQREHKHEKKVVQQSFGH